LEAIYEEVRQILPFAPPHPSCGYHPSLAGEKLGLDREYRLVNSSGEQLKSTYCLSQLRVTFIFISGGKIALSILGNSEKDFAFLRDQNGSQNK